MFYNISALLKGWGGGGGGGGGWGWKSFNENLFSIFDMGPLIDFRLTIQSEKLQ